MGERRSSLPPVTHGSMAVHTHFTGIPAAGGLTTFVPKYGYLEWLYSKTDQFNRSKEWYKFVFSRGTAFIEVASEPNVYRDGRPDGTYGSTASFVNWNQLPSEIRPTKDPDK